MLIRYFLVFNIILTLLIPSIVYAGTQPVILPEIIITSVKTGGESTADQEFVELYNPGANEVNIDKWQIRYSAAGTLGLGSAKYTVPDQSATIILPGSYLILATASYLTATPGVTDKIFAPGFSDTGGHIILVNATGIETDRIGWGTAQYAKVLPAVAPKNLGQSLKRCVNRNNAFRNTNSNTNDFVIISEPMHRQLGPRCLGEEDEEPPEVPPEVPDDSDPVPPPQPVLTCEGIIISELLANPAGSDSGKEFIELHNPTNEVINLDGCNLQTSSNQKQFAFSAIELQPGQFHAFFDSLTGLTLPNAAGGTVWILTPDAELQAVTYPESLADDVAWALVDTVWQASYAPTPNNSNVTMPLKPCLAGQERNAETNICKTTVVLAAVSTTPCKPGQERNPDTNRCRTLISLFSSNMTPCKEGQERSLETNRCKSVLSSASTLTPCKPGQERNPDTNRCRSVLASNTSLKQCSAGQERNPDTNRCRNVSTTNSELASVKDVQSATKRNNIRWIIAGVSALAALCYGIYEWRRDIANIILKRKLKRRTT